MKGRLHSPPPSRPSLISRSGTSPILPDVPYPPVPIPVQPVLYEVFYLAWRVARCLSSQHAFIVTGGFRRCIVFSSCPFPSFLTPIQDCLSKLLEDVLGQVGLFVQRIQTEMTAVYIVYST